MRTIRDLILLTLCTLIVLSIAQTEDEDRILSSETAHQGNLNGVKAVKHSFETLQKSNNNTTTTTTTARTTTTTSTSTTPQATTTPSSNNDTSFCQNFIPSNQSCIWQSNASLVISSTNPCIFQCIYDPSKDHPGPVRFSVHERSNPLISDVFISVRQNHVISSWTLPITFPEHGTNQMFSSIAELLCPPRDETTETLFFRITTHFNVNVTFNISLTRTPYKLELGDKVIVVSTPVSPWFKLYQWEEGQQSVLITADSVGKNGKTVCSLLSLQNAKCPVETDKKGIMSSGGSRYQTFQLRGGMVAKKSVFPDGVHIVILPLPDDALCTGHSEDFSNKTKRSKSVQLQVLEHRTISEVWGTFAAVGVVLGAIVIGSTVSIIVFGIRRNLDPKSLGQGHDDDDQDSENQDLIGDEEETLTGSSSRIRHGYAVGGLVIEGSPLEGTNSPLSQRDPSSAVGVQQPSAGNSQIGHSSRQHIRERLLAVTGGNIDAEIQSSDLMYVNRGIAETSSQPPADITQVTRQNNPRYVYWWKTWAEYENETPHALISETAFPRNLIMVAVFMALPFSEILRSYMHAFAYEGSEDKCYYNARCITSWGIFPDFTRIFTNICYLLSGIMYICILKQHRLLNWRVSGQETLGVSRNYSLFMSLAIGLIIQFFMSALYHICPNDVTLRFDMVFMYVVVIVLIVGVWGFRHGSVAHHVYPTVGLVGTALLAAEFRDWVSSWFFWLSVGLIQGFLTITTSVMMFKFGTWSFSPMSMVDIWKEWKPIAENLQDIFQEESKIKPWTLLRLVVGLAANFGFIIAGWSLNMESYMYILVVCLVNMGFYVLNYVFTKKLHGEKGTPVAWICLGVSAALWVIAFVFFFINNTNSEATASVSRAMNSDCILLGVFDAHDIWHVTSSLALFFGFAGILTLDDDLASRNPRRIPVF